MPIVLDLANLIIEKSIIEEKYSGGIDAFTKDEKNPNAVLINQEDYEKMKDVVDKFNTVIGRRDIMKALIMKAGMKLKQG